MKDADDGSTDSFPVEYMKSAQIDALSSPHRVLLANYCLTCADMEVLRDSAA